MELHLTAEAGLCCFSVSKHSGHGQQSKHAHQNWIFSPSKASVIWSSWGHFSFITFWPPTAREQNPQLLLCPRQSCLNLEEMYIVLWQHVFSSVQDYFLLSVDTLGVLIRDSDVMLLWDYRHDSIWPLLFESLQCNAYVETCK